MKKFAKVMLVVACIFLAAGIGFSVAGAAMGATVENMDFSGSFKEGAQKVRSMMFLDNDWDFDWDDDDDDHGHTAVSSANDKGVREYTLDAVDEMEIDLSSDELILRTHSGNQILVEVENDTSGNVKVESDSRKLEIESTKRKSNRRVTISYPAGKKFSEVDICVSAGNVSAEGELWTDQLSIEIGAGEFVNSASVTAETLEVEVGAGSAEIQGLTVKNIDGECGVGSLCMSIKGNEEDYNYNLECGIGDISIGSNSYSGLAREKDITYPGASGTIDLECGIGEIEIDFE